MKKLLALILALLMAFGMIACDSSGGGGGGGGSSKSLGSGELDAQDAAEEFFDNIYGDPDAEAIMEMMPTDLILDAMEDEEKEEAEAELDELIDEMQTELDDMHEMLEDYDWDYSVEVVSEEEYDVTDLDSDYEELNVEVEEAVWAECEITLSAEGEEDETEPFELIFVKIDGQWYVDPSAMDDWV